MIEVLYDNGYKLSNKWLFDSCYYCHCQDVNKENIVTSIAFNDIGIDH